jgi:hypothetical protein
MPYRYRLIEIVELNGLGWRGGTIRVESEIGNWSELIPA